MALPCFLGLPHSVLGCDFWVPGSTSRAEADRFKNKDVFASILKPDSTSVMIYFSRVMKDTSGSVSDASCIGTVAPFQDFSRKASPEASWKAKARGMQLFDWLVGRKKLNSQKSNTWDFTTVAFYGSGSERKWKGPSRLGSSRSTLTSLSRGGSDRSSQPNVFG